MKEGYAASQRQPHEMIAENDGVEISTPCISQGEAANLLNVSRATVTEAKKVLNEGTAGDVRHGGAGGVCATLAEIGGTRSEPPKSAGPGRAEEADAAAALARHMRRALEGALDHGTALLAALGLPRLMEPGFVPLDPAALGDAIHLAIGTLDALDAPGADFEDEGEAEPWLGWIDGKPVLSDSHDDREVEDEREPDDEGDPLDRGELDGWRRPRRARLPQTEYPPAMAEREVRRLMVIVSPNVVPLFGGRHG